VNPHVGNPPRPSLASVPDLTRRVRSLIHFFNLDLHLADSDFFVDASKNPGSGNILVAQRLLDSGVPTKNDTEAGNEDGAYVKKQDEEQDHRGKKKGRWIPRPATLNGFALEIEQRGGVDPTKLLPLTQLEIVTRNTTYWITVVAPLESKVLIREGHPTGSHIEATLSGASFSGGSFLKQRWIGVGMQMELYCEGGHIITSPVASVQVREDVDVPLVS